MRDTFLITQNNWKRYPSACCRLLGLIWLFLLGIVLTLLIQIPIRLTLLRQHHHLRLASWWHRRLLSTFNVNVRVIGSWPTRSHFIVSNHISWLDIIVLGGQLPVHFVSKAEVRRWPVIGWLAAQAGTLFIQRGAHGSQQIIDTLQAHLAEEQFVAIFPEGTTSKGDNVKPFHPRLFAAAIETATPVLPVTLIYTARPLPHPVIPYVDDDVLLHNLWQLALLPSVEVELHIAAALHTQKMPRKTIAQQAHQTIQSKILNY